MLDQVEVAHTNLSEVSRVVLIEVDTVVVLTASISATSRVLAVLANAAMTSRDVTAEVPVRSAVAVIVVVVVAIVIVHSCWWLSLEDVLRFLPDSLYHC